MRYYIDIIIFASNYNELHCKYNEKRRKNKRKVIANALVSDIILGDDPKDTLSPMHEMLYSIIRFYVKQDSMRHRSEEYALSAI